MKTLRDIGNRSDLGLLALRLVVGIIFIAHGWAKYQTGMNGVANFFGVVGIPLPLFNAYLVTAAELFGGAALILGILSRYAALALSITMVVAIYTVKWEVGLIAPAGAVPAVGYEFDLVLLAGLLAVFFQGAGKYSLEHQLLQKEIV